jgi:hypothetical protein
VGQPPDCVQRLGCSRHLIGLYRFGGLLSHLTSSRSICRSRVAPTEALKQSDILPARIYKPIRPEGDITDFD